MKAYILGAIAIVPPHFAYHLANISVSSASISADAICSAPGYRPQEIDRIIGGGGFNRLHPLSPGISEQLSPRITESLKNLEELLRSRDVSDWPDGLRAERMRNIKRLHA